MKTTTIITITCACITSVIFSSCSLDPEYRDWKNKQKAGDNTANPYGAPAANTTNPYGVPQAAGETGTYTPANGTTAPYQPLPGVTQPATPSPAATPSAGATTHTVVSGDSLWGLARKYGTTIESIQAANGLTTTNIRTGQTLTIPSR